MASFEKAVEITLKHEGGYTVDTGGPTMRGITQAVWDRFKALTGRYSGVSVQNISVDMAKDVYRTLFWPYVTGIQDQAAANVFFDSVVNMGPAQAAKIAQRTLNAMGESLRVDGEAGQMTWAAINRNPLEFVNRFTAARKKFYEDLVKSNPQKYGQYLAGWIRRANQFLTGGGFLGIFAGAAMIFYLFKRG